MPLARAMKHAALAPETSFSCAISDRSSDAHLTPLGAGVKQPQKPVREPHNPACHSPLPHRLAAFACMRRTHHDAQPRRGCPQTCEILLWAHRLLSISRLQLPHVSRRFVHFAVLTSSLLFSAPISLCPSVCDLQCSIPRSSSRRRGRSARFGSPRTGSSRERSHDSPQSSHHPCFARSSRATRSLGLVARSARPASVGLCA